MEDGNSKKKKNSLPININLCNRLSYKLQMPETYTHIAWQLFTTIWIYKLHIFTF